MARSRRAESAASAGRLYTCRFQHYDFACSSRPSILAFSRGSEAWISSALVVAVERAVIFLNYLSLAILLGGLIAVFYTFIFIHDIPYAIA